MPGRRPNGRVDRWGCSEEGAGWRAGAHGSRRGLLFLVGALLAAGASLPPAPLAGQGVVSRSPNLAGGWVAPTGSARFHLVHRFRTAEAGDETRILVSPTFLLAVPITDRILVGAQYASSSFIASGNANEWELLGRWGPPTVADRLSLAITAAYNGAAESGDGEISARLPLPLPDALPFDSIQLVGAARIFSDALGTGESGWFAGGGVLLHFGSGVALAGDVGTLESDGVDSEAAWGVGLQIQIPTTPHTLSLHATNTRTATLQGSSVGTGTTPGLPGARSTFWGFEFTVPLTYARLFPWL